MTAKKTPEQRLTREQKQSGGARPGAGRKGKLVPVETQLEWNKQLTRAVTQASGNMGVIKNETFWTLRQVQARWGKTAAAEFKYWFEAVRHLDQQVADRLFQEFESGKIDDEKFKKLLFTTAFSWVWSIRTERQRNAWELTRGLRTLH
jgi:hypothetical protein